MPSVTPQARLNIGGSEPATAPQRATLKASTGMNFPVTQGTQDPKTGQAVTTEETSAQAVTLSPQLTALARKQQKLQMEVQAQRDKEAQWEKEKANYVSKDSFKAKAQQNAVEALSDLGFTYDEITNLLLTQSQGDDPVTHLANKVESLEKAQKDAVDKQFQATLKQYRSETDDLITADPRAYHLIKKGSHQDAVVQHIVDTWEEDPDKVLTVQQAAKEVEEYLREDAKQKADALKELEPTTEETPVAQTKKTLPPPTKTAPRTLTNSADASPAGRTYGQFQHLSMKERIAQAIARTQR